APAIEQPGKIAGLGKRVIHACKQAVLNGCDAAAVSLIAVRGGEHVLDIKAPAPGQEVSARGIIRSMQGQGEMHAKACLAQLVDAWNNADGGDGDLPPAECSERG